MLGGEKSSVRTAVLLNAGAGIAAHEAAGGDLESRLQAGIDRATESIDSGSAAKVLDNWAKTTQTLV